MTWLSLSLPVIHDSVTARMSSWLSITKSHRDVDLFFALSDLAFQVANLIPGACWDFFPAHSGTCIRFCISAELLLVAVHCGILFVIVILIDFSCVDQLYIPVETLDV